MALRKKLSDGKSRYEALKNRKVFREPYDLIRTHILTIDSLIKRMQSKVLLTIKDDKIKLAKYSAGLDKLSPLKTLSRGYSVLEDCDGKIIKSVNELNKGDKIKIILHNGEKNAEIL